MSYWRLFYHIVWATKNRESLILDQNAQALYSCVASKAKALGAIVHAVGGMEDHVHLVASVPPNIALSEFTRQVKGNSSHFANHELELPGTFKWQPEFGVMSFDSRQLNKVVQYVKRQKEHHSSQTTVPALERILDNQVS